MADKERRERKRERKREGEGEGEGERQHNRRRIQRRTKSVCGLHCCIVIGEGMVKYGQFVVGPAGSGKSTYCKTVQEHLSSVGKSCIVVNLDPAAEKVDYECSADIRALISVDDAAEELRLGPNGSLVFCMEYLADNMSEWMSETVGNFVDDDYVLFDCPGQAELYEHLPCMQTVTSYLEKHEDFRLCCVYVLEAGLVNNASRFMSGILSALSATHLLELPHVSLLTKVDLISDEEKLTLENEFLEPEASLLLSQLDGKRGSLDEKVAELIDDYSHVSFQMLDISSEESIEDVLNTINHAIQFGEDAEPKDRMNSFGNEDEFDE